MTLTPEPGGFTDRPLDLGTPEEEGVAPGDAADRAGLDPEEQPSFTEVHPEAQDRPPRG